MRRILIFFSVSIILTGTISAQSIRLEECIEAARASSPLRDLQSLNGQSSLVQNDILQNQWLPSASLNARGTYQSDVITFPENSPLGSLPSLPKAQYRATLDISQPIYEGGAIKHAQRVAGIDRNLFNQQVEVTFGEMERSITELYFGVLEAREQTRSLEATIDYLSRRRSSLESAIRNGVLLSSELASYDQEILRLRQQVDLLNGQAKAMQAALAVQIGSEALNDMVLTRPVPDEANQKKRPEYLLYDLQQAKLTEQQEGLSTNLRPKVAAFVSAGLGQPNPYNFINTDFSGFYMVGITASWSPFDWGTTSKKKQLMSLQTESVRHQESLFERQVAGQKARIQQQLATMTSLTEQDNELIRLQEQVLTRAESQLDNGTLTTAEYLAEVQKLTRNRLSKELHQLQALKLQIQLQQL